jgi:adenylate cyclase
MSAGTSAGRRATSAAVLLDRRLVLAVLLLVPVAGFALLLVEPALDVMYHHDPMHFWIVLTAALINVGLGYLTSGIARRQGDARLFLVSMALLSGAAFLGLHALATPGVLLRGSNTGFVVANPVGLLLASVFAAASALALRRPAALLRSQGWIKGGLAVLVVAWAACSLAGLPPLGSSGPSQQLPAGLQLLGIPALVLYGFAAVRYGLLYRERRRTLLLAVAVAYVLLAEAMVAVTFADTWHATWWEWHLLMVAAFATIAVGARNEYRRARSLSGALGGLYLDSTLEQIDRHRADALASLVAALRAGQPLSPILDRLRKEWATTEEVALLERAAYQLQRTDDLFRPYISPQLAAGLEEHPELAALGGLEREVSVLFADLSGFTDFSEKHRADEVITMLNTYWSATVPVVAEREGGVIERFAGDAIMVVFNAVADQPDHALRAARAALAMRDEVMRIARSQPGWPQFRIGVNTGPAVVGHVGAARMRSFTAIGDTTNLSARLQARARPGHIVIGQPTLAAIGEQAQVERIGPLRLKGKREPVEAFELVSLSR